MFYGSKFFGPKEFACHCGCGLGSKEEDVAKDLIDALHNLRQAMGLAFVIDSGARCTKHNIAVHGRGRSTHLPGTPGDCFKAYEGKTRAADVSIAGWTNGQVADLVAAALRNGMRVGVAKTFIHLDVEKFTSYPRGLWSY